MRQLFSDLGEVDPVDVYGRLSRVGDRPSVRLNMIASVDGAATLTQRSGALGGPADKAMFSTLRSLSDVILVGAATMRTEGYGPVRLGEAARQRRHQWGLVVVVVVVAPIAVVTRACRLDWSSSFFTEAEQRPVVITASLAATTDRDRAGEVADVIVTGDHDVDLTQAMRSLGERGHDNVLAEGGPGVAAQLAEADLLDELCLTVSPLLVVGDAGRILDGDSLELPTRLELLHVLETDGYLFLRYRRP
jgi:riboflavin biosynthesis pyrimidine reductase